MAAPTEVSAAVTEPVIDKGLKQGALGLTSSIVMGIASTAPAYSLAAVLFFVIDKNGAHAPGVILLAFVPMYCIAVAYQKLNEREPDCGTTFTWGAKVFHPAVGWMGGWGIIAADVLVMANLGQVAGQYFFDLVGAHGLAQDTFWYTVAGVLWLGAMTWISYKGIEVSARTQLVLLSVEVLALGAFATVALVRAYSGDHPPGGSAPHWSWLLPTHVGGFSGLSSGLLLAVFLYWGWDTSVSANEETTDAAHTPGRAAVISTFLLLATYALVALAAESFAGVGDQGLGLHNPDHQDDVLSVLGHAVLGGWFVKVLIFMVLTSSAASALTSIIPTARTSLSMAAYGALPRVFGKVDRRSGSPTVSTLAMGGTSIVLYVLIVWAGPLVYQDAVGSVGIAIAVYYGLTGFTCAWAYREDLVTRRRAAWQTVVVPLVGGCLLAALLVYGLVEYIAPASDTSFSYSNLLGLGAAGVIGIVALALGVLLMLWWWARSPAFFRRETFAPDDARDVLAEHSADSA